MKFHLNHNIEYKYQKAELETHPTGFGVVRIYISQINNPYHEASFTMAIMDFERIKKDVDNALRQRKDKET